MSSNDYKHNSDRAFDIFQRVVIPQWEWLQKQTIMTLEDKYDNQNSTTNEIAAILDRECGIDVLIKTVKGWAGLALRTQEDGINWRTFTIRRDLESGTRTEFEKLCDAIDSRTLYPKYMIQSYTDGEHLLSAAIGYVEDIIGYIRNHPDHDAITRPVGNARFFYVSWDGLKRNEYSPPVKLKMETEAEKEYPWPEGIF